MDKSQIQKIHALQAATAGNCVAGKAEGRSTTFRCPQAPAQHEVSENGTSDTAMCGDCDAWVSSTTFTSSTTNSVIINVLYSIIQFFVYDVGTYPGKTSRTPGANWLEIDCITMLQHSSRIFLSNAKGKQCFPLHSNDLCLWRVLCMGLCFKLLASYGWFSGLAAWNRFSGSIRMSCPMQVAANDVTFSAVKKACARGGSPNSVGHWRETCELLRKMPFLGIQLHLGRKSVVDMEPWKCHGEVLEKSALEKSCIGKHKRSAGDERCKGLEKVSQTSSSEERVFHWKA